MLVAVIGAAAVPWIGFTSNAGAQLVANSTPLGGLMGAMVVDPATAHVFVSLHDASKVVVLDFDGNIVGQIGGLAGARGLAVVGDHVYVAASNAGAIDEIDTATLTVTRTVASGLVGMNDLVFAAGALWVTSSGLTRVALNDGTTSSFGNGLGVLGGGLAGDPADTNTLIDYTPGSSPVMIARINVSTLPPKLVVSQWETSPIVISNVNDIAVSPDGTKLVPAGGAPYQFDEFATSTLQATGVVYPANPYPTAVAMTPASGGLFAGGINGVYDNDIVVYHLDDSSSLVGSFDFGVSHGTVNPGGLAFSPDGTRLFAITTNGTDTFHVLAISGGPPPTTTTTSPTTTTTPPVGASAPWSRVSSPNVGSHDNTLWHVSCASTTACVAVGDYRNTSNVYRTLIESWNGATWTHVSSPNAGVRDNHLGSVSCVSATSCIAIGFYINTNKVARTLIESWDGASWTIRTSPNVGAKDNVLSSVSCVSSTSCIAVGLYVNTSNIERTLVDSWDGASWTHVPSVNVGASHNFLNDVSCAGPASCITVGGYTNTSKKDRTLIESWNGTTWTRLSSPNVGTNFNYLDDVSCVSATSCTAVGAYKNTSNVYRTLTASWNGTTWTQTSSPNVGAKYNVLWNISCTSATSCIAVGSYENIYNVYRTLIETWNGSHWTHTPSPNAGSSHNFLWGVSCIAPAACTAVGSYATTSGIERTFIASSG